MRRAHSSGRRSPSRGEGIRKASRWTRTAWSGLPFRIPTAWSGTTRTREPREGSHPEAAREAGSLPSWRSTRGALASSTRGPTAPTASGRINCATKASLGSFTLSAACGTLGANRPMVAGANGDVWLVATSGGIGRICKITGTTSTAPYNAGAGATFSALAYGPDANLWAMHSTKGLCRIWLGATGNGTQDLLRSARPVHPHLRDRFGRRCGVGPEGQRDGWPERPDPRDPLGGEGWSWTARTRRRLGDRAAWKGRTPGSSAHRTSLRAS